MKRLVVILGLLPLVAMAKPPHGHHGGGGEPSLMLADGRLPPYLDGLNLTTQQEADIKILLKTEFGDRGSRQESEHAAIADLHALSFSTDYSEDKAKSLLEKSVSTHQQMALAKSKVDHAIFMMLTASQQETLKANIAKFEH